MDNHLEWTASRVKYIRQLKHPTKQQELLVMLSNEDDRSAEDEKMLKALIRAEKAIISAEKAKADVTKRLNAATREADKKRTHELIQSGLLMVAAGLVDSKTGKLKVRRSELVGALAEIAKLSPHHEKRLLWQSQGSEILARFEDKKKQNTAPSRAAESTINNEATSNSEMKIHHTTVVA